MALETGTYISDLVSTNPTASDNISNGDDHLRLLKSTIKATFPNISGAVNPTHTMVNTWFGSGDGTATPSGASITTPAGAGTNIAGVNLSLLAGNGTGTGGSGVIRFLTAAAGTTGSTANTLTERMRIDNAGNVCIGTALAGTVGVSINPVSNISWPESATESLANIFRQSNSGATIISNGYKRSGTANGFASSYGSSWAKSAVSVTAGSILFYTDPAATTAVGTDVTPTERMRINSSGNVGIGTTNPASKLVISNAGAVGIEAVPDDATGAAWYYYNRSTSAWATAVSYANQHIWNYAGSSEGMRLNSSGNVGIGTASPSDKLHVTGNVRSTGSSASFLAVATTGTAALAAISDARYWRWLTSNADSSFRLVDETAAAERTRIDSSGYTYETNVVSTQSTAATLTANQVLGGILVTSPSGAITLTMPTGTDLDAVFPNTTGMTRDLTVVNTTANVVTIAANTGVTLTGGMQPTSSNPCLFRLRRTGSATYTMYRAG